VFFFHLSLNESFFAPMAENLLTSALLDKVEVLKDEKQKTAVPYNRALRDGHFDFGRDRDGMDPKTAVSGRDRS
jgi:hypothetical protein